MLFLILLILSILSTFAFTLCSIYKVKYNDGKSIAIFVVSVIYNIIYPIVPIFLYCFSLMLATLPDDRFACDNDKLELLVYSILCLFTVFHLFTLWSIWKRTSIIIYLLSVLFIATGLGVIAYYMNPIILYNW